LPICADSWNHVQHRKLSGRDTLLVDMFQVYAYESLQNLKSNQDMVEMLVRASDRPKAINPITYVMRYCVKARRSDERSFNKKLMNLGREHARIGVDCDMMITFCEVLLTSFASCFPDRSALELIMHAWVANLRYIIAQMTRVSFSFQRSRQEMLEVSNALEDCACESEDSVPQTVDDKEDCISIKSIEPIVPDSGSAKIRVPYDGMDHMCYPIIEQHSCKEDVSVVFGSSKFVAPIYKRELSDDSACDTVTSGDV
jgi:hypothetical protein